MLNGQATGRSVGEFVHVYLIVLLWSLSLLRDNIARFILTEPTRYKPK